MDKTSEQLNRTDEQDFSNALSDMTDQLRIMEQKVTMAADNSIRYEYENHQQDLQQSFYMVRKLQRTHKRTQKKKILGKHHPFSSAK